MNWKKEKHLKALLLIANHKIKKDFENNREIHYIVESLDEKDGKKEYIVKRIWKCSHEIYTCDCENSLTAEVKKHLKESPMCYHKLGVILFVQQNEVFK